MALFLVIGNILKTDTDFHTTKLLMQYKCTSYH